MSDKGKCLYPDCKQAASCRADYNNEYSWHTSYGNECDGSSQHKWICDEHWNLVKFLKDADLFEVAVRFK